MVTLEVPVRTRPRLALALVALASVMVPLMLLGMVLLIVSTAAPVEAVMVPVETPPLEILRDGLAGAAEVKVPVPSTVRVLRGAGAGHFGAQFERAWLLTKVPPSYSSVALKDQGAVAGLGERAEGGTICDYTGDGERIGGGVVDLPCLAVAEVDIDVDVVGGGAGLDDETYAGGVDVARGVTEGFIASEGKTGTGGALREGDRVACGGGGEHQHWCR